MFLIEPCCTQKHIPALYDRLGNDGTTFFHGYGDLSLAELLPPLLARYTGAEMLLAAPSLPNGAAKALRAAMETRWGSPSGDAFAIGRMTIVTDLRSRKSPMASAWLSGNPFPGRLELRDVQQNDTAVILPDIALYGCVNLVYGGHFSGIATRRARTIGTLREMFLGLAARQ